MATVHRICPSCGKDSPMEARHCPHCGYDTQAGLPVPQDKNLPAVVGKAALPMIVTAGTIAARMMWKLFRDRAGTALTASPAQPVTRTQPVKTDAVPASRRKSTIHIRSSWAVGDAKGVWRQGQSEHHIEIEE